MDDTLRTINLSLNKSPGFHNWWLRRRMPVEDKLLLYVLYKLASMNLDYVRFRMMLTLLNRRLIKQGTDMKLPRYWGLMGEYPEWGTITDRINKWGYHFTVHQG